jgi:dihydroflavonol-4-reductase
VEIAGKVVAVTGANGFLGAYVVRALHRAGAKVRAVVRDPVKAAFLSSLVDDVRQADLLDPATLPSAVAGADAVVSVAGLWTTKPTKAERFRAVNVTGVENLMGAVVGAGVKRVVHVSTFGVHAFTFGTLNQPLDESARLIDGMPWDGAYRTSKARGEEIVVREGHRHGVDVTILRPAGMYGARDGNVLPWLRRLLKLPVVVMPSVTWPFSYAGDVAQAVVASLLRDEAIGKTYELGGEALPIADLLAALAAADGTRARIVRVPGKVGIVADSSAARRDLGFTNRSFVDGFRQTVEEERRGLDV